MSLQVNKMCGWTSSADPNKIQPHEVQDLTSYSTSHFILHMARKTVAESRMGMRLSSTVSVYLISLLTGLRLILIIKEVFTVTGRLAYQTVPSCE